MTEEDVAMQQIPMWIEVPDVPVTKDELTQYAGEKCSEFVEHCASCKAWKEWEGTGKITVLIDREILLFGH